MKRKLIITIIICSFIILAGAIRTQVGISYIGEEKSTKRNLISAYTPHESIEITNDGNFTDYGFPGTGEETDPFIIEGFNITTEANYGIHITDTTKYFVISDCFLDATYGIFIVDVAVGTPTIINNTCTNTYYGIYLIYSLGAFLTNNTCTNTGFGIVLSSSSDAILTNNTCRNSSSSGISLVGSSFSTLINNTCNNSTIGISLDSSPSSTLINNTFTNDGLYIRESSIEAYLTYTIENNSVNDKQLGFFINLDEITISETIYGQLILINCTETTVRNQDFSNIYIGLYLRWCENVILINNTCIEAVYGIYLWFSSGSTLINNTCSNNYYWSISVIGSSFSTLINNTCNNNTIGIYLDSSSSSTLINNTCNNNRDGIRLEMSASTLINNTCNNNTFGIVLWHSSSVILTNNICSNNNDDGIYLYDSSSCLITYNLLQENEEYGINLGYNCHNNIIHHNNFKDNNLGGNSQGNDEGSGNVWYDVSTTEGNYWSDWSGFGPYPIDGVAGSVDSYPLDEEGNPPVISEYLHINGIILTIFLSLVLIYTKKKKSLIRQ